MASKHGRSFARPRRAGENFARSHHIKDEDHADTTAKKVKFDVRNPSALAFEERDEEDVFLEADTIGRSAATKRGAVNIDGFDSDSENETFNARAQERKKSSKGHVNLEEQFDGYGEKGGKKAKLAKDEGDDDDVNMFGDDDSDEGAKKDDEDDPDFHKSGKKKKEVRFLDDQKILGQELLSKSGGHVNVDEESDTEDSEDDDDEEGEGNAQEEVDEEVGAGGLKKHAPKLEAFNLKEELAEGRFDENQNYVRNAGDADAVHDQWLEGLNTKQMKKAAAAHQKRDEQAEQLRRDEDRLLTSHLLSILITHLERGETPIEALARLGKSQKKEKKIPAWKLKKKGKSDGAMETDTDQKRNEDPEQARIRAAIEAITVAADKLLSRDHAEIYDQERELLIRDYKRDTGEDWVEARPEAADADPESTHSQSWEFRWTDGRDGGAIQGPFDGKTMKAWQDAGYFGEGVEFCLVGGNEGWTRLADFA